jgi:DNA (cytosine-5)-methyltransferase 1
MNGLETPEADGQEVGDVLGHRLDAIRAGASLRTIDLFSGCGGMSLGLRRAGFTVLGGIEHEPAAARTHAINFFRGQSQEVIDRHSQPHDITSLTPAQFARTVLGADVDENAESADNLVDVIVGGPPCQAFARIGRAKLREIRQHREAHLTDTRASLYLNYLEYVDFFMPLVVVMENVPDIMNFGGQNVAEEIASTLEDMGYRCHYTVLNSSRYGVPQMRHRFYLLAFLDEHHRRLARKRAGSA